MDKENELSKEDEEFLKRYVLSDRNKTNHDIWLLMVLSILEDRVDVIEKYINK